jgi:hypothetical protein
MVTNCLRVPDPALTANPLHPAQGFFSHNMVNGERFLDIGRRSYGVAPCEILAHRFDFPSYVVESNLLI